MNIALSSWSTVDDGVFHDLQQVALRRKHNNSGAFFGQSLFLLDERTGVTESLPAR